MRGVVVLVVVAACGDNLPAVDAPPQPWTSGSRIRAEVFTSSGLRALGGRWDPTFSFECFVDGEHPPAMKNCPPEITLVSSDNACAREDLVAGVTAPLGRSGDRIFDVRRAYDGGQFFWQDPATGTCYGYSGGARFADEISADDAALGTVVVHTYEGIRYEVLETDDGFSIITHVDGANHVIDDAPTRVRARWVTNGPVRMYAGMFDTELDTACVPAPDRDYVFRCVPPGYVHFGLNAGCPFSPSVPYATKPGLYSAFFFRGSSLPGVDSVWDCRAGTPVDVYEPRPMARCDQIVGAVACTPMPLDSMQSLSLVGE